ncbi:MAG: cadherin repeat domain-containing protein [Pirellula sp.]|nr:cadherin repeat domain-containing protein [Pirellula sp.]
MASPASVGTTILDALGNTFFGARESIKLAFNEIGHTIREVNAPFQSHSVRDATAFDLGGLSPLYVPNLVPESGHTYSGKVFDVSAIAVVGELKHEGSVSETDVYRFTGRPGEWVNIELIANGLRPVRGDLFDGRIRVYRANGELLAENDDEFEGTKDATLFDVKLPEDGAEDEEYYIEVSLSEQPAFGQGGRYELFVSRFRDLPAADGGQVAQAPGDTLIGGVGSNVIRGGAANDKVFATQGAVNDLVFGQGGSDTFDYLGLDYTVGNLDSVESVVNQNIAPTAVLDGVPTVPIDSGTEFTVRLESPYFDPSQSDTAAGFRFAFELKRDDGTVVAGSLTESYANASTIASRDFVVTSGGNYIVKARILDQQSGYRDYVRNLEVLGGPENEPPTEIVMDVTTVAENQPIGTLVGTLTAIDPDEDDQHTFTLVDGEGDSDNAIFEIVGREIRTLAVLDYEAKSQYSIRVRATDSSGSTLDRSFALNVLNIPELIGDIVVGDGTIQRSLIKQLTMVFDSELEIDSGAFKVQQRLFDANNLLVPKDVPILVQQTPLPNGHWQVQITFVFSGTDYPVRSGSLALQDGNYQLIIDGSKIRSNQSLLAFDADGNGTQGGIRTLGANEADRFYAFFGDLRGIRAVGAVDNNELRKTLGKTSSHPDFNGLFDANGDNAIGAFDNNEMRKSLLKRTLEWR